MSVYRWMDKEVVIYIHNWTLLSHKKEHIWVSFNEVDEPRIFSTERSEPDYTMRNAGLEETQAGIKIAGRNINNLRYADDTTLMAESEEELKSLLMKMKEKSEKFGWKLNIQKTKIMESDPITSWEIDRETVETVAGFILGGSQNKVGSPLQMVTADMKLNTYSLEEKLWPT